MKKKTQKNTVCGVFVSCLRTYAGVSALISWIKRGWDKATQEKKKKRKKAGLSLVCMEKAAEQVIAAGVWECLMESGVICAF